MTSTISSGSKTHQFFSMYRWSMRKNLATAIVYSVFLLFSYPLLLAFYNTLSTAGITDREGFLLSASTRIFPGIIGGIAMLFALLVPVFMFSYLHKKRSVDMFGALPMSRRTLFFSRYLAGLTLLLVPLFLCTGVSMLLSLPDLDSIMALLNGMLCITFSTVVSYTFTAFIAVCCGTTADTVISVLAINCLYPAAVGICQLLSTSIMPGILTAIEPSYLGYTALSPYVTGLTSSLADAFGYGSTSIFEMPGQLLCWFVLFAACFAGCIVLSKRRKAESAQAGFAFRLPAIVVRFIASATVGLFFASMFGAVSTSVTDSTVAQHHFWFVLGLVIGAFITHLVVTFIYNRGVKGFLKSLIPYAVTIVVILAGYAVLVTGMFGSDMYVPKADEVKSVKFLVNNSVNNTVHAGNKEIPRSAAEFSDKKQIADVINLHNKITGGVRDLVGYPYTLYTGSVAYENSLDQYRMSVISMEYTLQNGSKVLREYNSRQFKPENISGDVLKLMSTDEYKEESIGLFTYGTDRIVKIESRDNDSEGIEITDKGEVKELGAALRQDILEDDFYGIATLNSYTSKGISAVQLSIFYLLEEAQDINGMPVERYVGWNEHDAIIVPQTYTRTWEVLGKYLMRPVSDEELKKNSYAKELFDIPAPGKDDTTAAKLSDGDITMLRDGVLDWFTVTLHVPENWDKDNVYCALTADQQFDVKYGEFSKCGQGMGRTVTYTVPNAGLADGSWRSIQFYDKAGHSTQKIGIERFKGSDLTVAPGQTFQTDTGEEYTLFEIDGSIKG